MRPNLLLILFIVIASQASAQVYDPVARSQDNFSLALIKTLRCAVDQFKDCRSDSLQYTVMQELEHRLAIAFPGSAAAIVRERFYEHNAYIEFRGYPDTQSVRKGVDQLLGKIKKALGDQLDISNSLKNILYYLSGSLNLKDKKGHFASNMEIMISSSPGVYLIPEKEKKGPKQYFILLKIYGGTPAYFYHVPPGVQAHDSAIAGCLRQLMLWAADDFKTAPQQKDSFSLKKKRIINTNVSGIPVTVNRGGGNHKASFYVPADPSLPDSGWNRAQQNIQSALNTEWSYFYASLNRADQVHYISKEGPHIELEKTGNGKTLQFTVIVTSKWGHPQKASMSKEDFDEYF